jgi:hypothetical protein
LTKSNNYSKLFNQRVSGEITREQYWLLIREFFEQLMEFSKLQKIHGNNIQLSGGGGANYRRNENNKNSQKFN